VDEFCYQHAGKAKASNCFDCMRPICVACVKLHGSHDYCPECSAAIGAKQLKRRIVLGAVAASVCRRRANRALPTAASPEPAEVTLGYSLNARALDALAGSAI
jgi:hypothetical protein